MASIRLFRPVVQLYDRPDGGPDGATVAAPGTGWRNSSGWAGVTQQAEA
jgi:hypothetical protein